MMPVSRRFVGITATAVAATFGLGATACIGPFESCDDVGNFGVQVTVVDSITGRPPLGIAVLTITEGTYTESAQASLQVSNGVLIVAAAHERPGTYTLRVTMNGYRAWTVSGIRVSESGRCDNVETVKVTARLQPI